MHELRSSPCTGQVTQQWYATKEKEAAMSTITAMYNSGWSLLGSGFTREDFVTISTLSQRSTLKTVLKPLTVETRAGFDVMKMHVRNKVGNFNPTLQGTCTQEERSWVNGCVGRDA